MSPFLFVISRSLTEFSFLAHRVNDKPIFRVHPWPMKARDVLFRLVAHGSFVNKSIVLRPQKDDNEAFQGSSSPLAR